MTSTRVRIAVAATATTLVGAMFTACTTSSSDDAAANQCQASSTGTMVSKAPATTTGERNIATNPEVATGYRSEMKAVRTSSFSVVTANKLATEAACKVLADDGSAADALVAAQAVLGLTEPQATGIGGGGFILYYDAATKKVQAYDGRETAPSAATGDYLRYISPTDQREPVPSARASGRSIGTPGIIPVLSKVQSEHGAKQWKSLFDPAISLADNGFQITPRLASAIADSAKELARDREAREYFLNPDGSAKKAWTTLTNPAYAKTLGAVATDGSRALTTGAIAKSIVESIGRDADGMTPGLTTEADLAGYQAKTRTALCTPYRAFVLCGMPPPSSGGIAVAATMNILSNTDLGALAPTGVDLNGGVPNPQAVHLISDAERLAYADRDKYVGDPDFVQIPPGLTDPAYLKKRFAMINPQRTLGKATAGEFGTGPQGVRDQPEHGTSHVSIVDKKGNVASMTSTVESAFGSYHMVDGFLLNNQLTDFSAEPTDEAGAPVANRVEPGKRPRSSMAPTMIFQRGPGGAPGEFVGTVGSPGGSVIIQFVVKTLVNMLDWNLDPQQAASAVDFGAANSPETGIGGEHPAINSANNGDDDPLVRRLRAMGHLVSVADQSSGLSAIRVDGDGYIGGADPRREGEVLGDNR